MRWNHQFHLPHAFVFLIFTLLVNTATITESQATAKEILLQFKGNITGDPYNRLDSWVSSGNPCVDFSDVFCNPARLVDKIVLWNMSLVGVLALALSGLKSLRVLTLFSNKFEGNNPVKYVGLQTLWKIYVSSNALSGSIPDFIGDLPSIRFLNLSKNAYGDQSNFLVP
ncbi:LRRNT_2 domain-containing protein [Cephalotus follicularis]|uniref:LRRNT_2 domain-containing protein n=1 Tax=Cephalotus follicularis TaxID=3775 RepID=A0A1Q3C306_CEPFO|nr:LRRNT_2 domain-containing protein [Cephalotus follicularis]